MARTEVSNQVGCHTIGQCFQRRLLNRSVSKGCQYQKSRVALIVSGKLIAQLFYENNGSISTPKLLQELSINSGNLRRWPETVLHGHGSIVFTNASLEEAIKMPPVLQSLSFLPALASHALLDLPESSGSWSDYHHFPTLLAHACWKPEKPSVTWILNVNQRSHTKPNPMQTIQVIPLPNKNIQNHSNTFNSSPNPAPPSATISCLPLIKVHEFRPSFSAQGGSA